MFENVDEIDPRMISLILNCENKRRFCMFWNSSLIKYRYKNKTVKFNSHIDRYIQEQDNNKNSEYICRQGL